MNRHIPQEVCPWNIRFAEVAAVVDALVAAGARTDAYPRMGGHIAEIRKRAKEGA